MTSKQKSGRWKRIAIALALYSGAVLVGLGSAWWVLKKSPWMNQSVKVGAWKTQLGAGSPDADMYTRASIAVSALLALDRSETMYFIATEDDQGRPLRAQCSYRIDGTPPKARWWSITAYADDMFLFDAPNQRYSLNGDTTQLNTQGQFTFQTGPTDAGGPLWLPTPGKGGLVLTLRLYNPQDSLQASPGSLQPPTIQPLGACT